MYFGNIILLAILFSSILIIKIILGEHSSSDDIQKFLFFSFSILNLYILISSIINKYRFSLLLLFAILFIIFIPILLIWNYYFISHAFFATDTLLAILQTNISESQEYLQSNTGIQNYFLFGFFIIVLLCLSIYTKQIKLKPNKYLTISVLLLFLIDIFAVYKYHENILTNIFLKAHAYTEKYQQFREYKESRINNINNNLNITKIDSKGIYVLVIGESQNKKHMSAYGYDRNTTPWLDNMQKANDNFILFNNAYSCHTHTVPVLTYALTAKNQYNTLNLETAPSIIEVAKAAGYDTVWLSNQVQYSAWDTPITIIATEAHQQDWINKTVGESSNTNFYDIKLLDSLNKINISDKMLIVIHLMGNHGSYKERYPKNFEKYPSDSNINNYDNSIIYNDYVMDNIYQKVSTLPNFKGLIYFSDHTDAVDRNLAHDAGNFVPDMTYIPLYIYLSNDYIKENPDIFNNLKSNQNSYFTNDLMFNTVLGIMNIKISDLYEPQNDITSSSYDNNPSRFKTLYGEKSIIDMEGTIK